MKYVFTFAFLFISIFTIAEDTIPAFRVYDIYDDYKYNELIPVYLKPYNTAAITFNGFDVNNFEAVLSTVTIQGKKILAYAMETKKMNNSNTIYITTNDYPSLPEANLIVTFLDKSSVHTLSLNLIPINSNNATFIPTRSISFNRINALTPIPVTDNPSNTTSIPNINNIPDINYYINTKFMLINKEFSDNNNYYTIDFSIFMINTDSVKLYFTFNCSDPGIPLKDLFDKISVTNVSYPVIYNDNLKCSSDSTSKNNLSCVFIYKSDIFQNDKIKFKPITLLFKNGNTITYQ